MSIFNKVLQAHQKKVEEEKLNAEAKEKKDRSDQNEFRMNFAKAIYEHIRPYFKKLEKDIFENGYSAKVETGFEPNGDEFVKLRFWPKKQKDNGENGYCDFTITGKILERTVVCITAMEELASSSNTIEYIELTKLSDQESLERLVESFFCQALDLVKNS